ncbi:MAG: hypothetical protein QNK37_37125 [Acidobacteriota bacterium]|nr:hypothetical protein [Acidobacteriota bacterium]
MTAVEELRRGDAPAGLPFVDFVYMLRDFGIMTGMKEVLDFFEGLEKGLAGNLDELFLFARLVFVKKPEHLDRFERAFSLFFYDIDLPRVAEGDPELIHTKQFREWLEKAMRDGTIPRGAMWNMSREELIKKFWETVKEQMEGHHGGNRWVGTGGSSPFGHSGMAQKGIRVHGQGGNRMAMKVVGDRRYIDYDSANTLRGDNIRQVLATLKRMVPVGAENDLDLDETIRSTCNNGGDIDLVFKRQELDRIKLVLLIDNGGTSMMPYVNVTRLLFSKVKDRFKDSEIYYFHNTIYDVVYKDAMRTKPLKLDKLLGYNEETRVFILGDASMAPEELMYSYGSISFDLEDRVPSLERLQNIAEKFKFCVWLNPILKEEWDQTYGAWTLNKIRGVFHMEDLTLRGVKSAVDYMRRKAVK